MICTVTAESVRKELVQEQWDQALALCASGSEGCVCSHAQCTCCSSLQHLWLISTFLSAASLEKNPPTVIPSHSHLPSQLPGAIYRRTCRSWWTPPKASATRCCFWIFLADFQTAGSETDQKQPSKTVKGACSLVIHKKNYLLLCGFKWPGCKWKCFNWLDVLFFCILLLLSST